MWDPHSTITFSTRFESIRHITLGFCPTRNLITLLPLKKKNKKPHQSRVLAKFFVRRRAPTLSPLFDNPELFCGRVHVHTYRPVERKIVKRTPPCRGNTFRKSCAGRYGRARENAERRAKPSLVAAVKRFCRGTGWGWFFEIFFAFILANFFFFFF